MHIKPKNLVFLKSIATNLVFVLLFGIMPASAQESLDLTLTQYSATLGLNQRLTIIAPESSGVKIVTQAKNVKANVTGGNLIGLYGYKLGTGKIKVCDSAKRCSVVTVKVQKKKDAVLAPVRSKVTLENGSSAEILVRNGANITAFSNSNAVRTFVEGNSLVLNTYGTGKATVTVCSTNRGCVPVYVTVKAPNVTPPVINPTTDPDKVLRIDRSSLILQKNQSAIVKTGSTIGVTATSSSKVAKTAVNVSQVTVYGMEVGEATITICDKDNYCNKVSVKVIPAITGTFDITPSNITIEVGQNVMLWTKNAQKVTATASTNNIKTTIKNDLVLVTGSSAGKGVMSICGDGTNCIPVYYTVKPVIALKTQSGNWKTFNFDIGQMATFTIPGNYATSYYITKDTNPSAADFTLDGKVITVKSKATGSALLEVCPLLPEFKCGTVAVNVSKDMYCNYNTKTFQLTETDVTILRDQSIDLFGSVCNGLMVNVSSPEIARTAINGNKVTIYGLRAGETNVKVCTPKLMCAEVKVTVNNL